MTTPSQRTPRQLAAEAWTKNTLPERDNTWVTYGARRRNGLHAAMTYTAQMCTSLLNMGVLHSAQNYASAYALLEERVARRNP